MSHKNKFIVFEGIDGCGKTTQLDLLARALRKKGKRLACFREPGGTALGEQIRKILLGGVETSMTPQAEAFLYMASRAELIAKKIVPALRKSHVLCDRYFYSTVAYQSSAGAFDIDSLWKINVRAVQKCMPNLVLLLDIDPRRAFARIHRKKDRIEKRSLTFYQNVRNAFLTMAKAHPATIKVLDASREIDKIHQDIVRIVHDIL